MRKNFTLLVSVLLMSALSITKTMGQYPGLGQVPLNPLLIPQFVDPLPHFAGLRVNAETGGNLIIKAVQTQQTAVSTGTVLGNGIVGTTTGAGRGNYFVYSISKDGGLTWTLPLWPSFTIEAKQGNPLYVEVRNELHGLSYRDVNIAADQTIMMASGVPHTGDVMREPYTGPVPVSLHLHGGEVSSTSDGGPYAWFTPGYEIVGKGFQQGVSSVLTYPNTQEAATLWFHEHSQLGLTRANVYAGMAGFYFLRGSDEENGKFAGFSGDDLVKAVTPAGKVADALHPEPYLPEIEIAIQDRMFDTKGQLYYTVEATNPDIHPLWSPEFFGDVITVNGKSWPYLSVAPRKYRFHFLDGSNARFYNMVLKNLATGVMGPAIVQIGTDGGLLDSPVTIDPSVGKALLLAPGERADVIIDFSQVVPGTVLTLMNDANSPFPDGDPVEEGTTDRIMQFIVNGQMIDASNAANPGNDKSSIPAQLRSKPLVKLTDFAGNTTVTPDVIRQITLNEVSTEEGPVMALINNSRFEKMADMNMFGEVTEKPVEGDTEKWQMVNLTMDAHPIHIHLVQFQLVSRQKFDDMEYLHEYMESFTGAHGGMAGMYMGGEGPPFPYNTKNSDGAIGGNPSITSFLTGPVIPAEPNEKGWKDVILAYPGQIMTYMVRFAPTDLALTTAKEDLVYPFDPAEGPGYLWHCHILEHEDNDMMRPMEVQRNPARVMSDAHVSRETVLLDQNYPNPVSRETEIRFSLPDAAHIQLKLFNYMGEEVKSLLDAHAPAGNQTIRVSADNLSNGIYFYQLKSGNYIATKRLIIAR